MGMVAGINHLFFLMTVNHLSGYLSTYIEFNGVMHFSVRLWLWPVTLQGQVELGGGMWTV